ncbi:YdeI/OmpD-associated family protein [Paenibacillus humicola]|uniref:YdeI/OmpD-associated family protein n=1 Tax=Paenibacillus humicola TaxID=3110540 RepID=UPI00237AB02C|nr:YdeI/OmpD-associated family protein [Paenibacillus humicola]
MKFKSFLKLNGKTATGIPVPEDVIAALGSGKKPAVKITVQGYTYRTTVGSMGGQFMIPVSAEHRQAAGLTAGDEVEVDIELDQEPRELAVPSDFAQALHQDDKARSYFEKLSYSGKRRFILPIEDAKTAETRQRRIDKAVAALREGKTQ